jgi:predicted enzyme related to lactoylglutathione lyase
MALTFSHVQLYVHDLSRAMRFYQRVLGFIPEYVAEPDYARLKSDAMQFSIALHLAHDPADVGKGAVAYLVSDQLDETIRALREKKVDVDEPRREGDSPRFTSFKDSEGNYWGLQESSSH